VSSERVKAFGREVRRRRLAGDLTLDMLGEAARLTTSYLGEVEAGRRRKRGPSLEAAFRIADGLGVELPDLLGYRGLAGDGIEAGRIVATLGPELRRLVLALLRGIAKGCAA